jgi:hypothetical protein
MTLYNWDRRGGWNFETARLFFSDGALRCNQGNSYRIYAHSTLRRWRQHGRAVWRCFEGRSWRRMKVEMRWCWMSEQESVKGSKQGGRGVLAVFCFYADAAPAIPRAYGLDKTWLMAGGLGKRDQFTVRDKKVCIKRMHCLVMACNFCCARIILCYGRSDARTASAPQIG